MASETKVVGGLRGGDGEAPIVSFSWLFNPPCLWILQDWGAGVSCETRDFFLILVAEVCRGLGFKLTFPISHKYCVTLELVLPAGT